VKGWKVVGWINGQAGFSLLTLIGSEETQREVKSTRLQLQGRSVYLGKRSYVFSLVLSRKKKGGQRFRGGVQGKVEIGGKRDSTLGRARRVGESKNNKQLWGWRVKPEGQGE